MRKLLITLALLASTSIPATAGLHPDINWLEPEQVKAEEKAPEQSDKPFTEDSLFNLSNTRLSVVIPKGFIWKNGEVAKCCEDDLARASFNFWVEKPTKNDNNVTQYGFQKFENDKKLKPLLMKAWEKRVRENMADIDKVGNFKSTALTTDIVTVGDGLRALAAVWYIMNENGVVFHVTQFEIWEGGQRDLIQFLSQVVGNDPDKDPNHQMILKMAQSLKMSRTEANPVW